MLDSLKNSFIKISHKDNVVLFGSCFSDNIAACLLNDNVLAHSNPFGTIFHPLALSRLLKRTICKEFFKKEDFFKSDNYWFCYEQHSSLAKRSLEESLAYSNEQLTNLYSTLKNSKYLYLTFGSSWAYEMDGKIVANCHQQKSSLFSKKLSSIESIVSDFKEVLELIKSVNSSIQIVLTVSPVRHYKDGIVENQQSKAVLLLAVKQLVDSFENVFYFPSYEFVIDELRDYVFFKEDKVHPNQKAIKLIYDYFKVCFFEEKSQMLLKEWNLLQKSLLHRSLHPFSPSNLKFKLKLLNQLDEFAVKSGMNLEKERRELQLELEILRAEI